jgi:hypothetical protein
MDLNEQWKVQLYINYYGVLLNSKGKHSCNITFPVLNNISTSFENMSNAYTVYNENFRSAYIVENSRITRDINSRNYIGCNFFPADFFNTYANKLLNLKYSDFYLVTDNIILAADVISRTGIPLTAFMVQTIRGVCNSAKIKFKEKSAVRQKSVDLTFFVIKKVVVT